MLGQALRVAPRRYAVGYAEPLPAAAHVGHAIGMVGTGGCPIFFVLIEQRDIAFFMP